MGRVMAICREQGFVPGAVRAVPEIADLETLVGLVACGLGVTILPSPFEALICSKRVVFRPIEDLRTRDADGRLLAQRWRFATRRKFCRGGVPCGRRRTHGRRSSLMRERQLRCRARSGSQESSELNSDSAESCASWRVITAMRSRVSMSRSCASSTSRKRSCDRRTAGPIFARSVRPVTVTRSCFVRLSLSRHSRLMSPLIFQSLEYGANGGAIEGDQRGQAGGIHVGICGDDVECRILNGRQSELSDFVVEHCI